LISVAVPPEIVRRETQSDERSSVIAARLLRGNTRSHCQTTGFRPTGSDPARAQMPRLADPLEDAMAYLGRVPVEKFLEGISRFQKDVYPQHQNLFEKLALGQRPEALFITCADSRIVPCQLTQTGRAVHLPRDWQCGTALSLLIRTFIEIRQMNPGFDAYVAYGSSVRINQRGVPRGVHESESPASVRFRAPRGRGNYLCIALLDRFGPWAASGE
jgi:hypothetical protein